MVKMITGGTFKICFQLLYDSTLMKQIHYIYGLTHELNQRDRNQSAIILNEQCLPLVLNVVTTLVYVKLFPVM